MGIFETIILAIIEGLTEFLPVSSTGHLLLMDEILGFQGPSGNVFEIVIQFGAILAVVAVYFQRLWQVAIDLPTSTYLGAGWTSCTPTQEAAITVRHQLIRQRYSIIDIQQLAQ